MFLAGTSLVFGCGGSSPSSPSPTPSPPLLGPGAGPSGPPAVLVGAGDIGLCGSPAVAATAQLIDRIAGIVFTTGDNAYPAGTAENFRDCYEPHWGTASRADAAHAWKSRLRTRRERLLHVFPRACRAVRAGILQLQGRAVAGHRPQFGDAGRAGIGAASVGAQRTGGRADAVHDGLLAQTAVLVRPERAQP